MAASARATASGVGAAGVLSVSVMTASSGLSDKGDWTKPLRGSSVGMIYGFKSSRILYVTGTVPVPDTPGVTTHWVTM